MSFNLSNLFSGWRSAIFILLLLQYVCTQPLDMAIDQTIFRSSIKGVKHFQARIDKQPEVNSFKNFIQQDNRRKIQQFNSRPNRSYNLTLNGFARLTQKEIQQIYLSLIPSQPVSINFAKSLINLQKKKPQTQIINLISEQQGSTKFNSQPATNNLRSPTPPSSPVNSTVFNSFTTSNSGNHLPLINPSLKITTRTQIINLNQVTPFKLFENIKKVENIPVSSLQNDVLLIAKNYLKINKNIPPDIIDNKIIPTYKYKGDLSTIKVPVNSLSQRRLLQQENSQRTQEIKDVDWSCLSGRIKAQGNCGACYAFAVLDNVGATLAIYHMTFFVELSAQQIIDCGSNSLTFGCEGGFLQGTFQYLINSGIYTSYNYPYISSKYVKDISPKNLCRQNITQGRPSWGIKDIGVVFIGDCEQLKLKLQKHPVTVAIAAKNLGSYANGLFDGCPDDQQVNHAVLLIGYKVGYGWRFKNSWGVRWGMEGYGWLKDGNTCRVCNQAMYPIPRDNNGYDRFTQGKFLRRCPAPQ